MNRRPGWMSVLVLIVVPAAISLAVTLLILRLWDRQQGSPEPIILPTHSSTAMVPPVATFPPAEGQEGTEGGAVAVATEAPSAEAACENPVHTVASGEVLGTIAEQYKVTIDDIISTNTSLDPTFNADFLTVGQQLVIPVCGPPTPVPTSIPTETPIVTRTIPQPIPTATNLPPGTVSVEIVSVQNAGDVTREAVELINRGSPIELEGWTISNGNEQEYTFPSFRLFSSAGVQIYTRVGENTPYSLFWGLDQAVWQAGDTVYLYDADGQLRDEFEITE